jgi:uncharacterized protein YceK
MRNLFALVVILLVSSGCGNSVNIESSKTPTTSASRSPTERGLLRTTTDVSDLQLEILLN